MKAERPSVAAIRAEWGEHWRVGVSVTAATGLGYTVWPSVSSMFVEPLQRSFGWSRGQIALTYYATILSSVIAPGVGVLVDRLGGRRVLLTALATVALCYGLLAAQPGVLWIYYSVSVVIATAGMATSGVTTTRLVSGAFHETRGFALGAIRAGLALSVALLPPLLFSVIEVWGFRAGFGTLGLLVLLIPLPLGWMWLPRRAAAASMRPAASTAPA